MAAPRAQDCHALISYYEKLYVDKYGVKPVVNRNKARWSFSDVLMGMSSKEVKDLLEFYLTTSGQGHSHKLDWFLYNYDKLQESMEASKIDAERRKRLREESEKRAREWRERVGNKQSLADD